MKIHARNQWLLTIDINIIAMRTNDWVFQQCHYHKTPPHHGQWLFWWLIEAVDVEEAVNELTHKFNDKMNKG